MRGEEFKRWSVGGALIGALALGSCSSMPGMHEQTWTMATTDKIPSAVGKVKVKEEKDGNTRVKVEVSHLAQPDDVFNATTYVVWLKPRAGIAQNVGVLNVDKKLNGSLETRTPFKDFTVLVTAERQPNATMPTGQSVMDTKVVVPS
jgi:hypothetical protein